MSWSSSQEGFRYPLAIWVVWHGGTSEPGAPDACHELARRLYQKLGGEWHTNDDVENAFGALPAVEVDLPVFFLGTEDPTVTEIDAALESQPAEHCVVLLVIDQRMFQHRGSWKPVVRHLFEASRKTDELQVAAVGATQDAHNAFQQTKGKKALEVQLDDLSASGSFYIEVLALLCFRLYGPKLPEVFVSHARVDGGSIASELHEHINRRPELRAWLDVSNIAAGDDIRDGLKAAIPDSLFMAIVTEQYVRRRWTRWEASLARQHNRPMVIVDALEGTLRRLTPELANAPAMRWPLSGLRPEEQVPALVLAELLRHAYHRRHVEIVHESIGDDRQIVPTLLPPGPPVEPDGRPQIRVYADPPLTAEELALQAQTDSVRFMTVTQYVAERGWSCSESDTAALEDVRVGVSVSAPPPSERQGLYQDQFNDLSLLVARNLLFLGAELAYGGDLEPGRLTTYLARMVEQYAPEKVIADVLRAYVSWPFWVNWNDDDVKERLRESEPIQVEPGVLSGGLSRDVWPSFENDDGLVAFARALTRMRREMTEACQARVAIGGPVAGSKGRLPGVVEEILFALDDNQPTYLVAAFGGAAKAVYDAIEGRTVPAFSLDEQTRVWPKYGTVWGELQGTDDEVDWDAINEYLKNLGIEGLSQLNGLTVEENRRLAVTRDSAEIAYWIAKGLGTKFGKSQEAD